MKEDPIAFPPASENVRPELRPRDHIGHYIDGGIRGHLNSVKLL